MKTTVKISVAIAVCVCLLHLPSIIRAQNYTVDNINMMEGFTFGAAAYTLNGGDFDNVFVVNNVLDDAFDIPQNSFRWALEQVNNNAGSNNLIVFNIPGAAPHVIEFNDNLPVVTGNVVIDGGAAGASGPNIIIDGNGVCQDPFFINNYEPEGLFHLQGLSIVDFKGEIGIKSCRNVKIVSNVMYNNAGVGKSYYMCYIRNIYNKSFDVEIKGNIIGSNLNLDYIAHSTIFKGISFYNDNTYLPGSKYTVGGSTINDRNVIANCTYGIESGNWSNGSGILPYVKIFNNFILNSPTGIGFKFIPNTNGIFLKNIFYNMLNSISLDNANLLAEIPSISAVSYVGGKYIIEGVTKKLNDTIEVFLTSKRSPQDAIKFIGRVVSSNYKWRLESGTSQWADPSFIIRGGNCLTATSTYQGQTSDFAMPYSLGLCYFLHASVDAPSQLVLGEEAILQGYPKSDAYNTYTYSWTGGGALFLSDPTSDSPVFYANAIGDYYLDFKVTDIGSGCVDMRQILISISNVSLPVCNEGQVLICHVPKGHPENRRELCVGEEAVDKLIKQGSYLGPCTMQKSGSLSSDNDAYFEDIDVFFDIYPNPIADKMFVDFITLTSGKVKIEIINKNGAVVMTLFEGIVESDFVYNNSFIVSNLPEGIYVCRIITDTKQYIEKIMINK